MRVVISWVAWYTDFQHEQSEFVHEEGPNYSLHAVRFAQHYDLHILLATGQTDEPKPARLYTRIRQDFPAHQLELVQPGTSGAEIYQFAQIKAAAEAQMQACVQRYAKAHQVEEAAAKEAISFDLLFSAGTTPMRTAWVLLHLEGNGYRTRLLQSLDVHMSPSGKPDFMVVDLEPSIFAYRLEAIEQRSERAPHAPVLVEALKPVYHAARQIALARAVPVLLQGESGTGKEVLARYIHDQDPLRKDKPFISVNCAALGPELLESRLFGHTQGAFTDAKRASKGYFEHADKGTLFLDEIGDVPAYTQVALLRVLQEGIIHRVGEVQERKIDVRIIVATNKPLREECEAGRFRWDLYYRLSVAELELPRVADYSPADTRMMLAYFMEDLREIDYQRLPLRLEKSVWQSLLAHHYPGNLREMRNMISRLYIFCDGKVSLEAYQQIFPEEGGAADHSWESVEKQHLRRVLEAHDYNLTQTKNALGWGSINTLKERIKRYGLGKGGEAT